MLTVFGCAVVFACCVRWLFASLLCLLFLFPISGMTLRL